MARLDDDNDEGQRGRWNMLILEDAGEFITADARQQYGQALSKLLNLSDGLLGQGLKLLVLMTTNEELRNLHPAITRNGRCLTNLEFGEFGSDEAREWMRSRGCGLQVLLGKLTLSDLFAAVGGNGAIVNSVASRAVGFVAR